MKSIEWFDKQFEKLKDGQDKTLFYMQASVKQEDTLPDEFGMKSIDHTLQNYTYTTDEALENFFSDYELIRKTDAFPTLVKKPINNIKKQKLAGIKK